MKIESRLMINYIFDSWDYIADQKYSDTQLIISDMDAIPIIMPYGACLSAMGVICIHDEKGYVSSESNKKNAIEHVRSPNGNYYSDTPRDAISLYNKEQEGDFFSQEIIANALFNKVKGQ